MKSIEEKVRYLRSIGRIEEVIEKMEAWTPGTRETETSIRKVWTTRLGGSADADLQEMMDGIREAGLVDEVLEDVRAFRSRPPQDMVEAWISERYDAYTLSREEYMEKHLAAV